jgi:hypothetical protein
MKKGKCTMSKKKYIMKKIIISANDEANLMSILYKMNIRNGCLEIHKNDSKICRISGFIKQFQPFNCGSQINTKLVFEYFGDHTLEE